MASLSPEFLPSQAVGDVPDFRQFISTLEAHHYLVRVDREADWRSEIGEVSGRSDLPMLFESITDYPGWRLFTGGLSQPAFFALALGLTPDTGWSALVRIRSLRNLSADAISFAYC